jgi:hypothetical protein
LIGFLFDPTDGICNFFQIFCKILPKYTASRVSKQYSNVYKFTYMVTYCSVYSRCYATTARLANISGTFLGNGSVKTYRSNRHECNNGTATNGRCFLRSAPRPLLRNGEVNTSLRQRIQTHQRSCVFCWSVPGCYNRDGLRVISYFAKEATKRESNTWEYNRATLFLGDKNIRPGPTCWGSLESETVKCGHESRGTRT